MGGTIPAGHFGRGRVPQSQAILPHPPTGYQATPFDPIQSPPIGGEQPTAPALSFLSQNQVGSREGSPITQLGFQQQIEQYKRELADQRAFVEQQRQQQADLLQQFKQQQELIAGATNNAYASRLNSAQLGVFQDALNRGMGTAEAFQLASGYVPPEATGGPGESEGSNPGEGGPSGPPGDDSSGPGPGDSSTGP